MQMKGVDVENRRGANNFVSAGIRFRRDILKLFSRLGIRQTFARGQLQVAQIFTNFRVV